MNCAEKIAAVFEGKFVDSVPFALRGLNVKASDRLDERKKSGGWFYCKNCGYNADRDYVATQNIARKVL